MNKNTNKLEKNAIILLFIIIIAIGSYFNSNKESQIDNITNNNKISHEISEYNGETYALINNNVPQFSTEDMNLKDDYYSSIKNGKVRNGNGENQLEKSQ